MIKIAKEEYNKILENFKNKPFELTTAYIDYQAAKGNDIFFLTDSETQPMILCWAKVKKIKFIGSFLDIQGPIFHENTSIKQLIKFFKAFQTFPYKGIFINSNLEYTVLFEESIRNADFKRPIGQSNTNLSIKVDTKNLNPDRNWKRNLKKASNVNFQIKTQEFISKDDCDIIEKLHAENSKLKKLNYQLKSNEIIKLCQGSNIKVFFLELNNTPIAARIISVEQNISYDVFACNSLESRNNGATQYLMQNIFDYLSKLNIKYFDFSRIPVGKKGAQGVYDFKRATRAETIQYNGEWVFFKNKKFRYIFFLYNLIINKKDFY